jgi:hypothetical protein
VRLEVKDEKGKREREKIKVAKKEDFMASEFEMDLV